MEAVELERSLATVHALLVAEDMSDAADIVRLYTARVEQTGYDNWNGGTNILEVYFPIPPSVYVRLGARRDQLEEQITARLKVVLETDTQDWYTAKIIPATDYRKEWRENGSNLPRQARVNIVDGLQIEGVAWNGADLSGNFLPVRTRNSGLGC